MIARTVVPYPPEHVYAFLARLDNHWHLGDRYLRLEHVSAENGKGRIAIRAPLGLRRTARTSVTTTRPPTTFGGTATVGQRTTARIHWNIQSHERGAHVALQATLLAVAPIDRLLLTLGGRRWLRRRFRSTLRRLADALDHSLAADRPFVVTGALPRDLRLGT